MAGSWASATKLHIDDGDKVRLRKFLEGSTDWSVPSNMDRLTMQVHDKIILICCLNI